MNHAGKVAGALAVLALVAAPLAVAKPDGGHGNGHGSNGHGPKKGVAYVFKGAYVDPSSVDVTRGNKHVRRAELVGTVVSFDFAGAKVSVADTNADGVSDLGDVVAGDKVVVKVKAPKVDPGPQPLAARQIVDQTNPAPDTDED